MEYFFLFFVLLFGCIYYDGKRVDKNNRYLIFEYIVIVLIFGLRYKVGGDTLNYFYQFPSWPSLSEFSTYNFAEQRYNIGWMFFSAVCKTIYNDFISVQIAQSIIVNGAVFLFFRKNIRRYFTAILLYGLMYIFTYNTEIMRAALVVSIFLYSYPAFKKKKWIVYYLFCILAFTIHSEAVVMFILPICYPLSKIKPTAVNLGILFIICILSVLLFNFIPQLLSLLSVSERALSAFEIYSDNTYEANLNGYIGHTFFMLPWFLFLWLTKDENNCLWRGFLILYIFFSYQQLRYAVFMNRACDCLYPFTIVAICYVLQKQKKLHDVILRICIISCVIIVLSRRMYAVFSGDHWRLFIPYSSVIYPEENYERYQLLREFQGF